MESNAARRGNAAQSQVVESLDSDATPADIARATARVTHALLIRGDEGAGVKVVAQRRPNGKWMISGNVRPARYGSGK